MPGLPLHPAAEASGRGWEGTQPPFFRSLPSSPEAQAGSCSQAKGPFFLCLFISQGVSAKSPVKLGSVLGCVGPWLSPPFWEM